MDSMFEDMDMNDTYLELAAISELLHNKSDMFYDFYEDMDIVQDLEITDLAGLMEWNLTLFEIRTHKIYTGTHKTKDNFE